ncbi:arginase family protein [Paenibacillus thalictri]|uniref:Arginase family protein n=1 Tax=Paenibacillus thalictri TaxID=2527873 RepID=A0A4Q9DG36_9BACL|nr:arginase family protein [Paenibacillus thalictri]TBL71067.1 arginase family protein [Paenibacillus thalictri]
MSTTNETDSRKTLRLLMPQWQGGYNPPYYLGAQLLNWLAPASDDIQEEVPVSLHTEGIEIEKGTYARADVLEQLRHAFTILHKHQPDRVVVLGGDCGVELAPIAYLNEKYNGDLAILWVDSHPDVKLPDHYIGQHAHVLAALLGVGDEEFIASVPKLVEPDHVLYVGLNEWSAEEEKVMNQFQLNAVTPEELVNDSSAVLNWLEKLRPSKVFIHFDLDVLDLREFRSLLAAYPETYEEMLRKAPKASSMETIIRVLQDVAKAHDIAGLGITEHFPWDAYRLQNMLQRLPLLGDINKKDKAPYKNPEMG